ncbi:MAG: PaaI family thioesterase [Actinomycetota bacterium]|nr:PaaI family thioesterase [Actinomycetota bacterium]
MDNPDRVLLARFAAGDGTIMALDSNPLAYALGGRITALDVEAGTVELRFRPGPTFLQGAGMIQGGAIAAMLDFAMAFTVLAGLPAEQGATTVNLNVSLQRPCLAGEHRARGTVERRGRSLAFAHAELAPVDGDDVGTPVATATSTMAIVALG